MYSVEKLNDIDLLVSLLDNGEESKKLENQSIIHTGETDSSDDEDNKYFESSLYNAYGKAIKSKIKEDEGNNEKMSFDRPKSWKCLDKKSHSAVMPVINKSKDVYTEPIFGMRMINPLVSSQFLKEKMSGRLAIPFIKMKSHVTKGNLKTDWVIGGVIISKSGPKVSQKGSQYMIWRLSDLTEKLLTVSLFLFGRSYNNLWKTNTGTVVGVLNPNVMGNKDDTKDEATLSVMSPDQVMIWGCSKDFGLCKAKKKNGEACTAFVNVNKCEYCVYHVQTEYRKFTVRSELQSPSCGSLTDLRNKVLGKSEVFYGGKSFTSLPIKKKKVPEKDKKRLTDLGKSLSEKNVNATKSSSGLALSQRTCKVMKSLAQSTVSPRGTKTQDKKTLDLLTSKVSIGIPSLSDPSLDKSTNTKNSPNLLNTGGSSSKSSQSHGKSEIKKEILQTRFNSLNSLPSVNLKNSLKESRSNNVKAAAPKSLDNKQNCSQYMSTSTSKQNTPTINSSKGDTIIKDCAKDTNQPLSLSESSKSLSKENVETVNVTMFPSVNKEVVKFNESLNHNFDKKSTKSSKAKMKALAFIRTNGPITKDSDLGHKPPKKENCDKNMKRPLSDDGNDEEVSENQNGTFSSRFIELMNQTSSMTELLESNDRKNTEEYFGKMERKEQLEEKMLNTFKLPCKAVKCLKCKYTWFSASDKCKADGHPLKIVDTQKRFFKCSKCGQRTVALHIIPLISCQTCGGSYWLKAPMMKERIVSCASQLSIRGGEQKFINSVETNGNLSLEVPED